MIRTYITLLIVKRSTVELWVLGEKRFELLKTLYVIEFTAQPFLPIKEFSSPEEAAAEKSYFALRFLLFF